MKTEYLLTRKEGDHRVTIFDSFWKREIKYMKQQGWRVVAL